MSVQFEGNSMPIQGPRREGGREASPDGLGPSATRRAVPGAALLRLSPRRCGRGAHGHRDIFMLPGACSRLEEAAPPRSACSFSARAARRSLSFVRKFGLVSTDGGSAASSRTKLYGSSCTWASSLSMRLLKRRRLLLPGRWACRDLLRDTVAPSASAPFSGATSSSSSSDEAHCSTPTGPSECLVSEGSNNLSNWDILSEKLATLDVSQLEDMVEGGGEVCRRMNVIPSCADVSTTCKNVFFVDTSNMCWAICDWRADPLGNRRLEN
mmetsp:Transcript_113057/g.330424  ORF Transcript_113057/g.330424 Transcript_113057/m.330424 type:complete len:268 (-) Transcript_113057:24-827(-)